MLPLLQVNGPSNCSRVTLLASRHSSRQLDRPLLGHLRRLQCRKLLWLLQVLLLLWCQCRQLLTVLGGVL